jgi:trans-L-3-hydroxyproline dehydratase
LVPLRVDIAYGGDSFVIVDSAALGFAVQPDEARDLAEAGIPRHRRRQRAIGLLPSRGRRLDHISFCQFAGPLTREGNELQGSTGCVIPLARSTARRPGPAAAPAWRFWARADRCQRGDIYRARSIIGSESACRIASQAKIGGRPAIVPIISDRAWISGVSQYMLDPADPWPSGYRLSDTWPRVREAIWALGAVRAAQLMQKMAMKYRLHDLLSAFQSNFKRFASRWA